nr:reverse transcriptase domain-containing protein [Tanacetum cinerariifolium]
MVEHGIGGYCRWEICCIAFIRCACLIAVLMVQGCTHLRFWMQHRSCQKHNSKVKSLIPITGCVLELANVHTWDDILKKFGVRKVESGVAKGKGKKKCEMKPDVVKVDSILEALTETSKSTEEGTVVPRNGCLQKDKIKGKKNKTEHGNRNSCMRTRSSPNLIVESFTIPKRRNHRRSKQIVEPELRIIKEIPVATMVDTRTMSELLQAPAKGYGDAIVIPAILTKNFDLKVGLLSLVTLSQFHVFERDDPHSHIRWFNKITSTLKYKNVPHDAIKLMLFLFSLEGAARTWLEKEAPRSIHTWEDLVSMFVNYFFPLSKTMNLKNDIKNFQQRFDETFSKAWDRFKDLRKFPHHGFSELHQIDTFYNSLTQCDQDSLNAAADANQQDSVKAVEETCVTCGGPHSYYECLATGGSTFDACAAKGTYNQGANPCGDLKAITTLSGVAYDGPMIPPTPSPLSKEVERETKVTKDKVQATSLESITRVQPPVILHFNISFADALLHMPKFASTFKSLLSNKEKLFELASTPLNENCSAVLLKKLPEKLRDPDKFLIPFDFLELEKCLAFADLGASINLMPLSVWKKLSLPELTPTRMTLELANRSVAYPVGVAEDIFMKVGKFYFSTDCVVVDYDVDPRVPLILRRPFLRTTRALIDVHGEELTLRVNDEAITFKFGHTSRYSRRSCTPERAEVYYECMEPFKSLMRLWVRNRSIAAIWLDKVVTPLIEPAIKGFAAAPAVLKPKRLKVDKIWTLKLFLDFTVREGKLIPEHHQCFPIIGAIKIDGLKVKRRGQFYHLSDWVILKSVLATNKNDWFISVDASCLEQDIGIQHVDQHMEEDRLFKNEISSKKRILDVQNDSLLQDATGSGPSVEKKRKTQHKEASVKASKYLNDESNRLNRGASCFVLDHVDPAVSFSIKRKTQASKRLSGREWVLLRSSGVPASAFINRVMIPSAEKGGILENTLTGDVTMQEVERLKPTEVVEETSKKESEDVVTNEEKLLPQSERKESQDDSRKDDIVTNNDAEKNLSEGNDKGVDEQSENAKEHVLDAPRKDSDESFRLNKGEKCSDQALTDVSMAVEEIVPQEIPSEISQKEKDIELFQKTDMGNESLSSSKRTSDCERDASALGRLIGAKGDLPGKDLRSAIQIDNHKEVKESSLKHESEVELSGRKKRVKKPAAKNKDKSSVERAENDEVLENTSTDDVGMQEVEISKVAELMEETSNKQLKDVGRFSTRYDAEILRAEKDIGQGNEDGCDEKSKKKNEKTDVEKKKTRKKKTRKPVKNGEVGMSSAVFNPPLNDHMNEHENTLLNTAKNDSDEVKGNEAQVSGEGLVTGLEDLSSKRRATQLKFEPEKSQSTDHQTSKDMTVSQVSESKDDVPQLVKVKKTKKTKKQRLVDSRNDTAIQPRKLVSENENKKVPTNVANHPNIQNAEQFKTSKKVGKVDAPRTSKSTHANKAQKPTLGHAIVKIMQKSTPVVNRLQRVRGSADDNTSLGNSSSGTVLLA